MFLHGSWLHLLGNMLFLFVFGNNVEDRFGRLRYLLFYLGCGLVATYGFAFANRNSTEVLIGASGAIAGVLGAYLVLYPKARVWSLLPFAFFIPLPLPAWWCSRVVLAAVGLHRGLRRHLSRIGGLSGATCTASSPAP